MQWFSLRHAYSAAFIGLAFGLVGSLGEGAELVEALAVGPALAVLFFVLGGLIGLPAERGRAWVAAQWKRLWAGRSRPETRL